MTVGPDSSPHGSTGAQGQPPVLLDEKALKAAAQISHEAWCDNCDTCSGLYDDDFEQARAVLTAYFAALGEEGRRHDCDAELRARPDYDQFRGTPADYVCLCGRRYVYVNEESEGAWWERVTGEESQR